VAPVFQGCGALGFFKGDSKEGVKETEAGKEQVAKEVTRLRMENINLKKKVDILKKKNEEIRKENLREIAKVEVKSGALNEELMKLREENQKIVNENRLLKERLQRFTQKKDLRELKIKVLSGDGNLSSAKRMAKRLMGMDYEIRLIGFAPRSNFKKNTVYFAPKFEKEGRSLVSSLGANTVLKPLTWSSIFDLIVVTVKNP
jgi:DNA mismatch repair ATPase MutS